MSTKLKVFISILAITGILLSQSLFILNQTEQAIVLQFGKPVEFKSLDGESYTFIDTPGLKIKIPFIQEVKRFNKKILDFQATDKAVLDLEKKNITVNAFAKYKIIDPLIFYQRVNDIRGFNSKMDQIFEAALRDAIGKVEFEKLLTKDRGKIMDEINDLTKKSAEVNDLNEGFGVKILDVRIVRADLPDETSISIYNRMRTEREREATAERAKGTERAKVITSTADKQVRVTLAKANESSLIIRGEGEAEAAKIYAEAYNKDPEFFEFYRAMQALETSLGDDNTKLVLSPDSDLLQYLKNSKQ
ncbi:MAG: protease modulator HflC [Rickettsiales bacterium]|nr:protease modulator HflC [Rickettsiales bacterium]